MVWAVRRNPPKIWTHLADLTANKPRLANLSTQSLQNRPWTDTSIDEDVRRNRE